MSKEDSLILFDVDGTLLDNPHYRVLPSTIEALKLLAPHHTLAIATGRAKFMLDCVKETLPYMDALVLMNGQYIEYHNHVIYDAPPMPNQFEPLLSDMRAIHASYGMECIDTAIGSHIDSYLLESLHNLKMSEPDCDPFYYRTHPVFQIWSFVDKETNDYLSSRHPEFQFLKWDDHAYDVLDWHVSKSKGAQRLAYLLGIDYKNSITFGDGYNDYEFIRDAGIGICMSNGVESTKSVAKIITDDCSHDGIYNALKQLHLI